MDRDKQTRHVHMNRQIKTNFTVHMYAATCICAARRVERNTPRLTQTNNQDLNLMKRLEVSHPLPKECYSGIQSKKCLWDLVQNEWEFLA